MTFQQIFAILRARWIVAVAVFSLVLGTVAGYTLTADKTYTATASVLLDVKNADPIAGVVSPSMATPAFLMTQVDIINSKRVGMKVIKNLGLVQSDAMRQKWVTSTHSTGNFEGWLESLLKSGLEARPSRGSNVIYVSYKAADPQFASAVANGFVQAYLESVVELRTSPAKQSKDFFDANARAARADLERTQSRLSEYQKSQDLLVTDERFDVETARLNELSNQVVLMQAAVADSLSRQSAAQTQGDRSPDVMANPLVASLKADLVKQQTALEQVTTRLGEAHPSVKELRAGMADTNRKLESEIRRVTSSVGVGNSVNVSRFEKLKSEMELQRTKVLKLKAIRDEAAILQRDVDSAQHAYDGVLARMSNTNLESQANQANISMLESAVAPSIPSSPRLLTNAAIGSMVAVLMTLAVVLSIELRDRRLRISAEVEPMLNQPLIGIVPSFAKRKTSSGMAKRYSVEAATPKALPTKA